MAFVKLREHLKKFADDGDALKDVLRETLLEVRGECRLEEHSLDPDEYTDIPDESIEKRHRIEPTKPSLGHEQTPSSIPDEDASLAVFRAALTSPSPAQNAGGSLGPNGCDSWHADRCQSPTSAAVTSTSSTSPRQPRPTLHQPSQALPH
ncbi:hypothetical protein BKA82DRAFT_25860 [Pisolithus tinctorius]|uniref:Uncharacterized protein n=1 Tax=Pisolithus tinctorius Marx 270 TaxID=870435 RepID=A0A0C3PAT7_PISTI|nr:hypothetical protein BKA82DRAFT_25860 [Pisolithus tinctorius]KIO04744.1 hypothetical protein M404DRAFT_25860 [Pisolithus tinctorius Marx 270]